MKKIIALCTAFTLLILACCVVPISSAQEVISDSETLQPEYTNKLNKIHFYFPVENKNENSVATMSTPEKNAEVPQFAYIDNKAELGKAINNMNSYCESVENEDKPINVTIEFKSGFENTEEYAAFQEEKQTLKTLEEVRDYKRRLAAFSKEFHRRENENNVKKLNSWNYENLEIIDYCPFVVFEMDKNDISSTDLLKLANDRKISNVSLSHEIKAEKTEAKTWTRALKEIEAFSTVNSGLYTGKGIKIGILEPDGVCDTQHENLKNMTIHVEPISANTGINEHMTQVASIIALMAPDAELYVSDNYRTPYRGLTWFIENGCDVVNCSFGLFDTMEISDGIYEFSHELAVYRYYYDRIYDYQIKANGISVVVAAGNLCTDNREAKYNPYKYITSPGLAYNAITVGGLDCDLGFFDYELTSNDASCYVTAENCAKPEISALFSINVPNYEKNLTGTSFSAPQVTACVALMLERYPSIAVTPSQVKAIIMSSSNQTEETSTISGSSFNEKIGAGCIGLNGMLNYFKVLGKRNKRSNSSPNSIILSDSFSVKKNEIIQAGLSWPVWVDDSWSSSAKYITNYDLRIYNSSGGIVYASALNYGNAEFVRYKATKADTYTVAVYQNGEIPEQIDEDSITLSCHLK